MGVSASGAADAVSLRVGNLLVGNREGAAVPRYTPPRREAIGRLRRCPACQRAA